MNEVGAWGCVSRVLGGVIGGSCWRDCNNRARDTQCRRQFGFIAHAGVSSTPVGDIYFIFIFHFNCSKNKKYKEILTADRLSNKRQREQQNPRERFLQSPKSLCPERVGEGAAIFHGSGKLIKHGQELVAFVRGLHRGQLRGSLKFSVDGGGSLASFRKKHSHQALAGN